MPSLRPFRLRPEYNLQPMVEVTATSEGRNRLRQLRIEKDAAHLSSERGRDVTGVRDESR